MLFPAALSLLLAANPVFAGDHRPLSADERAKMVGTSWREGCPVPLEQLERVGVSFIGFDGAVHQGALIVHREVAAEVVEIFRALFALKFPIEKLEPIDAYGGDDDRSMAADNSSAFNCRPNASNPAEFSRHAFGKAIDLNPLHNPYVRGDEVKPPGAKRTGPGVIGDEVRAIFHKRGWTWGGAWKRVKDYQHFETR